MLETIEVKEASTNGRHEENGYRYMGALHVLYRQEPGDGVPFKEIRQWTTLDGGNCDLLIEWGAIDEAGDLHTQTAVLPFRWTVTQALEWLDERMIDDGLHLRTLVPA